MSESPESKDKKVSFVVSGDVTVDFNIGLSQENDGNEEDWNQDNCARVYRQRGSVLMLTDLLRAVVRRADTALSGALARKLVACPQDSAGLMRRPPHSFYTTWLQYEKEKGSSNKVWRIDNVLGFQRGDHGFLPIPAERDNPAADVVVLDDGNLGFRQQAGPEFWTGALLNKETPPWVVVKMCDPIAEGNLWKYLHENHAERLIAVLTIDDLRLTKVQISRELSWELTAQDLVRELVYCPSINALSDCAYVVVLFGADGAVLLSRPESDKRDKELYKMPQSRLFFDPNVIEGGWRQDRPGGMIGYKSCMAASIARSLMENGNDPKISEAIVRGLLAMRTLHLEGYGRKDPRTKQTKLTFPIDVIAGELVKSPGPGPFVDCEIRHPVSTPNPGTPEDDGLWTILSDRYREGLNPVARRIVLEGAEKVLTDVPLGRFGKLLTVDRREIESFRSIRTLVSEYVESKTTKPLSIAVFGAPGSGKSFGIEEIAESLLPDRIKKLKFNLSQFGSPQDLWGAMHQVRDVTLSGKLPLVFWDEFDTKLGENNELGWLRYFLAPMQDGEFQDGQITHPIGKAVFVFAGGTAEKMEKFGDRLDKNDAKEAKVPDFTSRLKGFVNILGPDPGDTDGKSGMKDRFYVIRRAILLRSLLRRDTPHFFDRDSEVLRIDEGVLRAFLETGKYKHGVRSMESVIAMSITKGKRSFERSSLPSEAQLELHVAADDFMSLVDKIDFSGDRLEELAAKVHDIYQEVYEYETPYPYDSMTDHEKDQNKDFVRDIINKLSLCNCLVVAVRGIHPGFVFLEGEVEMLARIEHQRWLIEKIKNNFIYASEEEVAEAKKSDPKPRLNSSMLFWDDDQRDAFPVDQRQAVGEGTLTNKTKIRNMKLIESIPNLLASVGYTVVRK
jgi:hypothetical protein